jgi:hypothetical protein
MNFLSAPIKFTFLESYFQKSDQKKHVFSLFLYEALQYYIIYFDLPKKILIKLNIGFK